MAWSGRLSLAPPTLADVAERAGVSRQTVSNAVNNPELLRPDTLARVQDAIRELGYSPNRAARNLRTRASHLIGMRFNPAQEGTANAAMDRFVHSLVETSADSGYHILLFENATKMPYEIAATAWGHLLGCPKMNDQVFDALRAFRKNYVDKGPEIVP